MSLDKRVVFNFVIVRKVGNLFTDQLNADVPLVYKVDLCESQNLDRIGVIEST